jgi:hypothetical protein
VQPAFLGGKEVVAPRDCLAKRALASRYIGASRGRELEAALEAAEKRRGRQYLAPGRRKLDGERKPVESRRNLGDNRGRLVCQLEIGPNGAGPLHEQHHSLVLGRLQSRVHIGRLRKTQRRNGILTFGGDA